MKSIDILIFILVFALAGIYVGEYIFTRKKLTLAMAICWTITAILWSIKGLM